MEILLDSLFQKCSVRLSTNISESFQITHIKNGHRFAFRTLQVSMMICHQITIHIASEVYKENIKVFIISYNCENYLLQGAHKRWKNINLSHPYLTVFKITLER